MKTSTELLSQLYDVHPAPPVPFWPPAPGWWIITIVLIGGMWWWYRHYYLSQAFKRIALQNLKQLRQDYQHHKNSSQLAMGLSILVRRVALVKFPHHQVSNLIRFEWLEFLNETGQTQAFTEGVGQVLCTAPYQKFSHIDADTLLSEVEKWIKRQ